MGESDKFRSELGMTRRDLLRRGAIVGGSLLWAAPVIQSIRTPANAAISREGSAPAHSCCQCNERNTSNNAICEKDGITESQCVDFCSTPPGNFVVAYHTGSACQCDVNDVCSCTA